MAEILISLTALTLMEIVLGIDNVVFIAILADKLPQKQQFKARVLGLGIALVMRIAMLFGITWLMSLTKSLFTIMAHPFSGKDLILLAGGIFLIGKASHEIFEKMEGTREERVAKKQAADFMHVVTQIVLLDAIFSLDSVITAVGMVDHLWMMITAVAISIVLMVVFSEMVAKFVSKHPSVKVLALSFLILVGVLLVAEGTGQHLDRGYVYFAMAFSLVVEMINLRVRKTSKGT